MTSFDVTSIACRFQLTSFRFHCDSTSTSLRFNLDSLDLTREKGKHGVRKREKGKPPRSELGPDLTRQPERGTHARHETISRLDSPPQPPMDLRSIPIGFDRFSIRMGWKWVRIDGKGYANTTYISEFHPHIPKPRFLIFVFACFSISSKTFAQSGHSKGFPKRMCLKVILLLFRTSESLAF